MDDPQREIDRIQKRTRRYWFDDGLAEIASGSGFLLVALYLVLAHAFAGRTPGAVLDTAFPLAVVVIVLAARRLIRATKDRLVHPRTGYVSFQERRSNRWANSALSAVIAVAVVFLIVRMPGLRAWIPALFGLMLAAGFLAFGRKAGVLRFPLEGLSCAILGLVLSILHVDSAISLMLAWLGVVLIAGGAAALAAYLRNAPAPTRDGPTDATREEA